MLFLYICIIYRNYFEINNQNILFISTNNNKLYYFTLDSCKILQLAPDFKNKSFILSPDSKKMTIKDTNNFIMVRIGNENENSEEKEDRIRKVIINEEYQNDHVKVEENDIIRDKEGNENENENYPEEEMEEHEQTGKEGEGLTFLPPLHYAESARTVY